MNSEEELLEIISNYQDVGKYLINKSEQCKVIGPKIGEGAEGVIFKVKVKGKDYAVKQIQYQLYKYNNLVRTIDYVKDVIRNFDENQRDFNLMINEKLIKKDPDYFYIFENRIECDTHDYYTRHDYDAKVKIGKSYICQIDIFTEYMISIICSQFLKKGISAHFLESFGLSTCLKEIKKPVVNFYFYMELIDKSLNYIKNCILTKDLMSGVIIQVLHSIYVLQTQKIVHGDLHVGNVFIKYIDEKTEYMGNNLFNIEYFHYLLDDKEFYIPATPFIVKIGDFGMSVKYEEPIIAPVGVLITGGIGVRSLGKQFKDKSVVPNWYNTYYDILTFLFSIYVVLNNRVDKQNEGFQVVIKLLNFIFNDRYDFSKEGTLREMLNNNIICDKYFRPRIINSDRYFSHINPKMLLESGLFDEYRNKPNIPKNEILTLGKI